MADASDEREHITLEPFATFSTMIGCIVGLVRSDLANFSGLLLSLVYFTLGHGGASGQTWGKKLAGIRVVHESGAPIGYVRALIRWAVAIGLSILLIIPNLIDVLWPLWDSKKQALRDKAVGSIVVYA